MEGICSVVCNPFTFGMLGYIPLSIYLAAQSAHKAAP